MIEKDDWRLTNQQAYLSGVTLYWKRYETRSASWDHDHCAFCWLKFMDRDDPEVQREGYTTENNYYWICKTCFDDFKEMFDWQVGDRSSSK